MSACRQSKCVSHIDTQTSLRSGLHIADTPITIKNWYKHVNWWGVVLTILIPFYACVQAIWIPLQWKTAVLSVIYYFMTGFGITAGYHRLWSHTSYRASNCLKIILALGGAGAGEGSIRWWARNHRAHHRYTDTNLDPYSVNKGLLYSHIGWLIMKQNPKRIGRVDISDLNEDAIVVWQHQNYLPIVIFMALLFPTLLSGMSWGDWAGGIIYAGILRMAFVHRATFCVNSLAHWLGDQPFDASKSSRDHFLTALLALGEGYHNFHHEFPSEYRNETKWYQYDPTKWVIRMWEYLGLAYDVKRFHPEEVQKRRLQQKHTVLAEEASKLDWGVPPSRLPVLEWEKYVEQAEKGGRCLIAIAGIVHDVTDFSKSHPGGLLMLRSVVGKDATAAFNGGVYSHSRVAHNLLATMRVASVRGGCEVEIWKKHHHNEEEETSPMCH
ncbi:hypothetical protein RU639_001491 [Aspergillus parasiticus]